MHIALARDQPLQVDLERGSEGGSVLELRLLHATFPMRNLLLAAVHSLCNVALRKALQDSRLLDPITKCCFHAAQTIPSCVHRQVDCSWRD